MNDVTNNIKWVPVKYKGKIVGKAAVTIYKEEEAYIDCYFDHPLPEELRDVLGGTSLDHLSIDPSTKPKEQ